MKRKLSATGGSATGGETRNWEESPSALRRRRIAQGDFEAKSEGEMSWRRKVLEKARAMDEWRAKRRHKLKDFDGGRMVRELSVTTVMNAVNNEGREVVTGHGAEEYWKDQERYYFGIGRQSKNGMVNRFGKVSWRKVY